MLTSTTMVLAILVETTSPILVARRPCGLLVVVSAIYFFLAFALALLVFLAAGLAFLAVLAAGFLAAAFFLAGFALVVFAAEADASAATGLAWLSRPSSFSRWMVLIRATSLRSPRTLFRLSVCPIFIWNFRRKS